MGGRKAFSTRIAAGESPTLSVPWSIFLFKRYFRFSSLQSQTADYDERPERFLLTRRRWQCHYATHKNNKRHNSAMGSPTDDNFLSTGQAARLYSVTPDAVLKWIRSGRLPARRTAGGHHRIASQDLQSFVSERPVSRPALVPSAPHRPFRYCWEHNGKGSFWRGARSAWST